MNALHNEPKAPSHKAAEIMLKGSTDEAANLEIYGVKIGFLQNLYKLIQDPKTTTMRSVCETKIKDILMENTCSVAAVFKRENSFELYPEYGNFTDSFSDKPNVFVCYSWNYTMHEVVTLLEQYLETHPDPSNVSFWIDMFCLPQHEYSMYNRSYEVKHIVKRVKNTIFLVPEYDKPVAVKRTWCIYEIFMNALYEGRFEVVFPRVAHDSFTQRIFFDIDTIFMKLCRIDVKASSTTVRTDKDAIMIEIDFDDGIKQFNLLVHKTLQKWVAQYIINHCMDNVPAMNVRTPDMVSSNANKVAYLLSEQQHFPQAKALFEATLHLYEVQYGALHPNTLGVANNLVYVLFRLELKDEAEAMSTRVIDGYTEAMGEDHANTITALISGADMLMKYSKFNEAEIFYKRVLNQLERSRGLKHPSTLDAVKNIAYILSCQKKNSEAEKFYQRALDGYMDLFGPANRLTCDTAYNFGVLLVEKGSLSKATVLLQTAYNGFNTLLGPQHEATLDSKLKMIEATVKRRGVQRAIGHLNVSKACVIS
jgi:tetratricopeptide (TPR) repeat protein